MAAHRGTDLHSRGWQQEGALRMLQNSSDPAVSTAGPAARDATSYEAIARTLTELGDDETLLVQSGRPVGVLRTHEWAPRVLLATANLVGEWANPGEFRRLEQRGLTMQAETASSWIDIGAQGTLHGAFETFAAVAADRFDGTLAGTITLTAGLGATGGAQPLGITMNGGVAICVEVDPGVIARRVQQGYLDTDSYSLDDALTLAAEARAQRRPLSIGVRGNAAAVFPAVLALGAEIDIVTDQSSAHDPMLYLPVAFGAEQWASNRTADPIGFADAARHSMAKQVEAMVGFQSAGAAVFDFGNGIRAGALVAGFADAFAFPGFMHEYIRPRLALGEGPVRWIALSGEAADVATVDEAVTELLPENEHMARWLYLAGERPAFPGLPARSCWLGRGEREKVGVLINELVAAGQVAAPFVLAHDYVDAGAVAAPYRETESMRDGSDAVADWPLLSALVATGSGATWVSISGGAGVGRSVQSTQATVADGTALAGAKLERGLTNETAFGVARYADAGYPAAVAMAESSGVRLPMRDSNAPDTLDS